MELEEKEDKRGNTAKLEKELREARAQIEIEKRKARLAMNPPKEKKIVSNEFINSFDEATKASMIEGCKQYIKTVMLYADKAVRRMKRPAYDAAVAVMIDNLEQWTLSKTGNCWKVKAFTLIARNKNNKPSPEDLIDIDFVHKGVLTQQLINATVTPEPVNIVMNVRVYRYELE